MLFALMESIPSEIQLLQIYRLYTPVFLYWMTFLCEHKSLLSEVQKTAVKYMLKADV